MSDGHSIDECGNEGRLTQEEEERLVERLYTRAIESKKASLEELEHRCYPTAPTKTISTEQLQRSVERQVDQEMQLRSQRFAVSESRAYGQIEKDRSSAVLTPEELEDSVSRLYDQSIARKKANMAESSRRFLFNREEAAPTKKMPKNAIKESAERMCKPKKTQFTTAEINKIYGLS